MNTQKICTRFICMICHLAFMQNACIFPGTFLIA